jgi:hypothetical protein
MLGLLKTRNDEGRQLMTPTYANYCPVIVRRVSYEHLSAMAPPTWSRDGDERMKSSESLQK